MNLLTKEIRESFPEWMSTDGQGDDAKVIVKFFTPTSNWTWYATEYDEESQTFFGLVVGHEIELGYFTLADLRSVKGPLGMGIERDLHLGKITVGEARLRHV